MPKPNCTPQTTADEVGVIDFGRLGRRKIEGRFDGGSMTSDAGVMLLAEVDRRLGLLGAAARCIADPRDPLLITHSVRDMLGQRGIKPEQLPAEEDIKKLERRVKSDEKKIEKQSGKLPKTNQEN